VNPRETHLYRIVLFGENSNSPHEKITEESGIHKINISNDFNYFIDTYSNKNTPWAANLYSSDGALVKVLEGNEDLKELLKKYEFPNYEFMMVPAEDGTPLHAYMLKPSNFDPSKKYPLLIYNYSGPAAQSVLDAWDGFFGIWFYYLAEVQDIIVACVDNRGTAGRGKAFASTNYKNLGTHEPMDQISAAKHWGELPYIDDDRMAIWGWSYGGYNAVLSMLKYDGPETFKLAIAVAPGVKWELYNTIYTERYMSTPQKNPEGYKEGNAANFADRLKDNQHLLLIHGDMDDNAHYKGTVHLISALQKAKKQFRMMVYPGGNHGLRGTGNPLVYSHLLNLMTTYIVENL
jgi:dipeptidyl-peptidase-4